MITQRFIRIKANKGVAFVTPLLFNHKNFHVKNQRVALKVVKCVCKYQMCLYICSRNRPVTGCVKTKTLMMYKIIKTNLSDNKKVNFWTTNSPKVANHFFNIFKGEIGPIVEEGKGDNEPEKWAASETHIVEIRNFDENEA